MTERPSVPAHDTGTQLVKRGLATRDAERVMGGNLYRLYRDVIG